MIKLLEPILSSRVRYLSRSPRGHGHSIDSLISLDQAVNAINIPLIGVQLLVVVFNPAHIGLVSNKVICIAVEWAFILEIYHRAVGNLGIATFRYGNSFVMS